MARQTKAQIAANEAAEAARVAEQQAELKRLRAEKRAAKKAEAQAPAAVVIDKPAFDPATEFVKRQAEIAAAWETLVGNFELPSWKRTLAGVVVGMAAAFGTGYLIGAVTSLLIVGLMAVTTATWLAYIVMALGFVLAAWAGSKVGVTVAGYITDKRIDAHYESAKSKVLGWFKTKPVVVQQFTGAHAAS